MAAYQQVQVALKSNPQAWLITGGAGFIGSHVVAKLLSLGQQVRVLDDFSTGKVANLHAADPEGRAEQLQGDIRDFTLCQNAVQGMDRVIHLAAMGSVPISMEKPLECHEINATGALNILLAAREAGMKRVVYASSSAVYGDDPLPQKQEEQIGRCLSPYAASKRMNEIHAQTLHTCYGLQTLGLRYFNVFGPRQDPNGAYAAVIPQWIAAMKEGRDVHINGDGENSRDFCFVQDVVQANLLAAMTTTPETFGCIFNVGLGAATSLNALFTMLRTLVVEQCGVDVPPAIYRDFRAGDIRHSCADASKAERLLGFQPEHSVMEGLRHTVK